MRHLFSLLSTLLSGIVLLYSQPYSTVGYQSLYTNGTYSRSLNTNLPVGAIASSQDVSLTGGATYNIPISVPSSTNGMIPSHSISYNSQGGDGHLGLGWSITGLSSISRVNRDLFNDTEVRALQLNNTDFFALNGNRLVVVSGAYGTNNAIYYTKEETFSRVTSYGDLGGGCPAWFKVETKEGITYEYGNSTDSRLTQESGTAVIVWALNKVYDCFGNYLEYKYKSDERDFRLDEINFTGNSNTGLVPYNKIKFTYAYRSDKNTTFIAGSSVKSNFLLTNIAITAENGVSFKQFDFTYGFDNIHSYLREISEAGDNGVKLNATLFKYGEVPANPFSSSNSSVIQGQSVDIFPGDFNGDGLGANQIVAQAACE